jgi:hypothetical protein
MLAGPPSPYNSPARIGSRHVIEVLLRFLARVRYRPDKSSATRMCSKILCLMSQRPQPDPKPRAPFGLGLDRKERERMMGFSIPSARLPGPAPGVSPPVVLRTIDEEEQKVNSRVRWKRRDVASRGRGD